MLSSWRVKTTLVFAHWVRSLKLTLRKRSSISTNFASVCCRFLLYRRTVQSFVISSPSSRQSLNGFSVPSFFISKALFSSCFLRSASKQPPPSEGACKPRAYFTAFGPPTPPPTTHASTHFPPNHFPP